MGNHCTCEYPDAWDPREAGLDPVVDPKCPQHGENRQPTELELALARAEAAEGRVKELEAALENYRNAVAEKLHYDMNAVLGEATELRLLRDVEKAARPLVGHTCSSGGRLGDVQCPYCGLLAALAAVDRHRAKPGGTP